MTERAVYCSLHLLLLNSYFFYLNFQFEYVYFSEIKFYLQYAAKCSEGCVNVGNVNFWVGTETQYC